MKKVLLFSVLALIAISMVSCDSIGNGESGHVHVYSDWMVTKEVSCSEDGIQTRICDGCDKTQTLTIPAEHSWSQWDITKDATCTEEGLKERICSNCQSREVETVAVLSLHPWGDWITVEEVTCTEDGERKAVCSSCGEVKRETVAATSHIWGTWTTITAATCTAEGEKERACSSCEIKERETVAVRSHSWSGWTTLQNATCTEEGARERVCSACELKQSENISKRSHSWSAWTTIKASTCTDDGERERACSSCEKKEVEIVAAAHSFLDGVCTVCNVVIIDNIIIPEAPLTFNYFSYDTVLSSLTITSLRMEIYNSRSVRIYYTAEKTYDYEGDSGETSCGFDFKLYDSKGYVITKDYETFGGLIVGDKVKDYFGLIDLSEFDSNETYTLVFYDRQ